MIMQFRTPFTVYRKLPGSYVKGKWQEGSISSFQILASVQPLMGEEMEMLPEGRRNAQSVKIYTRTQLNTVNDANPDILIAFNSQFEILTVEPWQSNVINHYKCVGVKLSKEEVLP